MHNDGQLINLASELEAPVEKKRMDEENHQHDWLNLTYMYIPRKMLRGKYPRYRSIGKDQFLDFLCNHGFDYRSFCLHGSFRCSSLLTDVREDESTAGGTYLGSGALFFLWLHHEFDPCEGVGLLPPCFGSILSPCNQCLYLWIVGDSLFDGARGKRM